MAGFPVRLRRKALADIASTRAWYRKIDSTLEVRFVRSLNEAMDRLRAHSLAYQVLIRNTRRMSLKSFPYHIYYVVRDSKIFVVAVLHHRRDPHLAKERSA
jgi:toxin ParE1/3/4